MSSTPQIDLDALADQIVDEGQSTDSALANLAKGITDGFAGLTRLLKGGDPEEEEEPEGDPEGDPDGDGEGEGDDPEEEEPDAGYDDLQKGLDDEEFIDATPILLAQQEEIASLRKAVEDGQARMEELFTALVEGALAPMAKAQLHVGQTIDAMLDTPAEVVDLNKDAAQRAGKRRFGLTGDDKKPLTGVSREQMAKGLQKKIIDHDDLRWLKHGQEIPEDRDGDTKMQQLRAL